MELKDAIYERRSVRKYKDTPISEEDIRDIMRAGIMAPSGMNLQPWYFVAIKNAEVIEELKAIMQSGTESFRPKLEKRFPFNPEVVNATAAFLDTLGGAPFAVLAFIRKPDYDKNPSTIIQSVAAAIQNMLLAAHDKGIGSCWLTSPIETGLVEKIKERFAPTKGDFVALLTFGYPDEKPRMPKRREEVIEYIF